MDFAPYQSSPPEHARSPTHSAVTSPRTSLDYANHNHNHAHGNGNGNGNGNNGNGNNRRGAYSPSTGHHYAQRQSRFSPPPLQHPQPQRAWSGEGVGRYQSPPVAPGSSSAAGSGAAGASYQGGGGTSGQGAGAGGGYSGSPWGGTGTVTGSGGGRGSGGVGDYFGREGMVSEFDTSLGLRLDYEACLAYLAVPPVGAILLLILERKSDYVRFHAWQSSLMFTALFVVHLVFSWSSFLSWVLFLADLVLIAWLVLNAYRDANTLDRYEVPIVGPIASRILDDE